MNDNLNIAILGLSITSSWGNGHATTYRALASALAGRGHHVTFLERDVPWYADNRDLPDPAYCTVHLYESLDQLRDEHAGTIREADAVIVGSFVPDGVEVGRWVQETATGLTAFYDIDTPVTLWKLEQEDHEYLHPELIRGFDLYLSFTGGPTLETIQRRYGAPLARPLYCSVDPQRYRPKPIEHRYDLGYLGTYSDDRQPTLDRLLLEPARRWPEGRFAVAGPQYPESIDWPENVERMEHLPPDRHPAFYNAQRFTLNVTRAQMIRAGYSPSVRLFEAAACGTPIISDWWEGLDTLFIPGREILVGRSSDQVLRWLRELSEPERQRIGRRARRRVLTEHTAERRAEQLERYLDEAAPHRASAHGKAPNRTGAQGSRSETSSSNS